jgi:hypothetical protein
MIITVHNALYRTLEAFLGSRSITEKPGFTFHSPPTGEPELVRRVRTNPRHPHPGHVQPSRPRAGPVPHPPSRHQTGRHPLPEPGLVPARPPRLFSHRVRRSLVAAADAAVAQRRLGCGVEAAALPGHHREAVQESRLLDHIHVPGRRHGVHLHAADQAGAGEARHMHCFVTDRF